MAYQTTPLSQPPLSTYLPSAKTTSLGVIIITALVGSILIGIGYLKLKGIGASTAISFGSLSLTGATFCLIIYCALSCKKENTSLNRGQNRSLKTESTFKERYQKASPPSLLHPKIIKDPARPHINVACETFVELINQQLSEDPRRRKITIQYQKNLTDPLRELPEIIAWKENPTIFDYLGLINEALNELKKQKTISSYYLNIWGRCVTIELPHLR